MPPRIDLPAPPQRRRRAAAFGAIVLGALLAMWLPVLPVFAPAIEGALRLDKAQLGRVFAASGWAVLAGYMLGGLLADRLDALRVMRAAAAIAAGLGGCLLISTPAALQLTLYCAFVVSVSAGQGSAMASLPRLMPHTPRRMISANLALTSGVLTATPFLLGWIVSRARAVSDHAAIDAGKWTVFAFGLVAIAVAIAHAILWSDVRCTPDPRPQSAPPADGTGRGRLAEVAAMAAILGALHVGTDNASYQWMPVYLCDAFAHRPFPAAWVLAGNGIAYLLGRLIVVVLPEQRWRRRLLIAPGILAFFLLLWCFHSRSYLGVVLIYTLASLPFGMEFPALLSLLARRGPRWFGMATALANAVGWGAAALWSWALGEVAKRTGNTRLAMLMLPFGFLAFSLVATGWVLWVWRRGPKSGD